MVSINITNICNEDITLRTPSSFWCDERNSGFKGEGGKKSANKSLEIKKGMVELWIAIKAKTGRKIYYGGGENEK